MTDSYAAARAYQRHHPQLAVTISGHLSFEQLFATLARYPNEYVLVPAAFKSEQLDASWGDLHYALLAQLTLCHSFITALDPLVVVARRHPDNQIGYTHAATAQLLQRTVRAVSVQTCASKYLAYQAYQQNQAAYVLTNERNVTLTADERLVKRFTPKMVWCLYRINSIGEEIS